jgi:hypothetical protein
VIVDSKESEATTNPVVANNPTATVIMGFLSSRLGAGRLGRGSKTGLGCRIMAVPPDPGKSRFYAA